MDKFYRPQILHVGGAFIAAAIIALASAAFAGNDTYTYDVQGRLLTVTYADGSSITYAYDPAGNRSTLSQTAAP